MKYHILFLSVLLLALGAGPQLIAQHKKVEVQKRISPASGAWLGVALKDAEDPQPGALVTEVTDESPADSAGIKENDIIVKLNGKDVANAEELVKGIQEQKPGTRVTLDILRNGASKKIQAVLGGYPSRPVRVVTTMRDPEIPIPFTAGSGTLLGMKTIELRSQLGKYFEAPNGRGLLIEEVQKKSVAAKAGLQAGDVIIASGDESIQQRRDLSEAIDQLEETDTLSLTLLRRGSKLTVTVPVSPKDRHGFFHNFRFNFPGQNGEFDFEKEMQKLRPEMKRLKIEFQGEESEI
jgi:S1-C subfamily serine protease